MGEGTRVPVPVYAVLEVYRTADLSLLCVLPSAEDEVNAAAFHPIAVGIAVQGIWGGGGSLGARVLLVS